jgi:protein involved in polysaccharide export with SLBB domain
MKRALIGTGLLLLLSGCITPSAPPAAQGGRPITQGERLVVVFSSVQNATTNEVCRTVDSDGNIDLPFLDNLRVLGLTPTEAATLIVNRYVPRERDLSVKVTRAP